MVYTCLFYQIHESGSKTPRLVSVTLQGADSHLGGTLGGHCYHVNSVVHQSCFSLREEKKNKNTNKQKPIHNRKCLFKVHLCVQSLLFSTDNHSPELLVWKRPLFPCFLPGRSMEIWAIRKHGDFFVCFGFFDWLFGFCFCSSFVSISRCTQGGKHRKALAGSCVSWRAVLTSLRWYIAQVPAFQENQSHQASQRYLSFLSVYCPQGSQLLAQMGEMSLLSFGHSNSPATPGMPP